MSPTVRHESIVDLDVVRGIRSPRAIRGYAIALLVAALGAGALLAADGAAFPPPGALLLLAIPLALSMNRFVFFPNETGSTADAAVIFAAVVGFRDDALWLGPLLLALLAGPLDAKHWEERAFIRMVYNSGATAIATLAGVVVFGRVADTLGSSWPALVGAVAVAAVPYVLVETVFGVILVVLHGERLRAAISHQLPVNAIAVLFALYGAGAGLSALEVGWGAAFLLLLPVPLAPELVLVQIPRLLRGRRWAGILGASVLSIALGTLAIALPFPNPTTLVGLVILGVLVGLESRVDEHRSVPMLAVVVVIAAVVVVPGHAIALAAGLAAAAVTLAAWAVHGSTNWPAVTLTSIAAAATGCAYRLGVPDGYSPATTIVAAVGAVLVFELIVVLFGTRERRDRVDRLVWSVPVLALAISLALAWQVVGAAGSLLFGLAFAMLLMAATAWGSPPWGSRVLWRVGAGWSSCRCTVAIAGTAVLAGASVLGALAVEGDARAVLACCAVAAVEATAVFASVGVRQWRFAPGPRARQLGQLLAASVLALVMLPPLITAGSLRAVLGLLAAPACVLAIARTVTSAKARA